MRTLFVLALSTLALPHHVAHAAEANTSAQAIAQKFAGAAEPTIPDKATTAANDAKTKAAAEAQAAKKKAEAAKKRAEASRKRERDLNEQRKVDEAEMLVRAKAEANEREAEQKRAEEEAVRAEANAAVKAEEATRIAAQADARRLEIEAEAEAIRRVAEKRKLDDERWEKLQADARDTQAAAQRERELAETRAREAAEREANAARETKAAAELQAKADTEAAALKHAAAIKQAEAEAADRAAQSKLNDEREKAEEAKRAALQADREAETLRLAEKLKEARRAKAAELERLEVEAASTKTVALPAPVVAPPIAVVEPRPTAPSKPSATLTAHSGRATVLLILEPGDYGIRRFNRTQADPVLCVGTTCWISQGPGTSAKAMPRDRALGNTLGGRAGACRMKLACVFRDVDLGTGKAPLQPVDLHVLRHDRREVTDASADPSCDVTAGRLLCGSTVRSATYRAWIVPELTAAAAGDAALEAALSGGLSSQRAVDAGRQGTDGGR
jgi:hypothetical protein